MSIKKRNPAADIIRILALFLVISVHFFLNNGFYSQTVLGERMYIMTVMRSFAIICVPLFLTLSGYLLRKKQLEKTYYFRIGKIAITYLLACFLCIAYSVVFLKSDFSIKHTIASILDFTAAPYAWYVEMYIGLFLLIPFLNIIYNSLPTQKSKIWLIITFAILTSLPSVLNVYYFGSVDWWMFPYLSSDTHQLIPAWWQAIYPITYYYIGCYLSEYGLKINKVLNIILIILCTTLSGTFCYWRSYKSNFIWGDWCGYQSLFNVILTLFVFVFIINLNFDKLPNALTKVIQKVSEITLGAYLVSYIFDSAFYPILSEKAPFVPQKLEYFIVIVPTVFILSLLTSYLLNIIQLLIEKIASFVYGLISKKPKNTAKTNA